MEKKLFAKVKASWNFFQCSLNNSVEATKTEDCCLLILNGGLSAGVIPYFLRKALQQYVPSHLEEHSESLRILYNSTMPFSVAYVPSSCSLANEIIDSIFESMLQSSGMFSFEVDNRLCIVLKIMDSVILAKGSSAPITHFYLYVMLFPFAAVSSFADSCLLAKTIIPDEISLRNYQASISIPLSIRNSDSIGFSNRHISSCLSVADIPGLYYIPNFITNAEHARLCDFIFRSGGKVNPTPNKEGLCEPESAIPWETLSRRCVAHFRRRFFYETNQLGGLNEADTPPDFPDAFRFLLDRLSGNDPDYVLPDFPVPSSFRCDQLTMNMYGTPDGSPLFRHKQLAGIAHHADSHQAFDEFIFIMSLHEHTVMSFRRWDNAIPEKMVLLLPCSLVILSGEARYSWTHAILEKHVDILSDLVPPLLRNCRISLTWRRGSKKPHHKELCMCPSLCDGIE